MKKFLFFVSSLSVIACLSSVSQPAPARYGKIDQADLEMKVYALDTTAEAVILCDYGVFDPNNFQFSRLLRMKVLKKEGSGIVNKVLNVDGLGSIKGCTYNLVDGEVVESKLKNESIFKERVRDDRYLYHITMPDVRVGSVVEIQYSFPLLPSEWLFQDNIPVRFSELRIQDSPYVSFQKVFYGFQPLYINEAGRWVGKDMPALRTEPFMNSLSNYLTKVEIELSDITIPGHYRFFTTSWEAVNKYLLNNQYFGVALGMGMFLSEDAKSIQESSLSEMDKMKAACDLIRKKIKWNDVISLYTSADLGSTYRKGSGNSADINLLLVQLLKKLDFETFPVALSTRENGIISPSFPTIDKLNYVIAGVKYNGKNYVFDATEPNLPAGMLPFRALNGQGRIINEKYSGWVDLSPSFDQKETMFCNMELDASGEMKGKIMCTNNEYSAYYFRNEFNDFNSPDEYVRDLESNYPGLTVNSSSFGDIDSIYKPAHEEYEVSLTGSANVMGDMISVNPMLIKRMEDNPFKMETRKYPIDFGHLIKKKYVIKLILPEGYEAIDFPKPCSIVLPDKSARFTYQAASTGNFIQVTTSFEINKTLYLESEYKLLKEFYNQVIAKEAEVIMLKKKI